MKLQMLSSMSKGAPSQVGVHDGAVGDTLATWDTLTRVGYQCGDVSALGMHENAPTVITLWESAGSLRRLSVIAVMLTHALSEGFLQ
jgi:hypothetical protein